MFYSCLDRVCSKNMRLFSKDFFKKEEVGQKYLIKAVFELQFRPQKIEGLDKSFP